MNNWFVLAVALLEFTAGVVYLLQRHWWLAVVWCCYGVACVGLFMVGRG